MYAETQCRIIVNLGLSKPIRTLSGVKQGCPASSGLFVMVIELLGNLIRSSSIKGFQVRDKRTNGSYFADDCQVLIRDERDYRELTKIMAVYEDATGAKFNEEKTGVMPLGMACKQGKPRWIKMRWVTHENCLGVEVGNTVSNEQIFEAAIRNLRKAVQKWNAVQCTIHGRAIAHNQALVPKVFYVATTNVVHDTTLHKIHGLLWNEYLWQGKPAKMNTRLTTLTREFASIGVTDLTTKIEASRIMTLKSLVLSQGEWTDWVYMELEKIKKRWGVSGDLLGNLARSGKKIHFDPTQFWQDCLRVWVEMEGGRGTDGTLGVRGENGTWIPIQNLSAKEVYNTILARKNRKEIERLKSTWAGWDIRASNRLVQAGETRPEVRQFVTRLRHGGLMVNARVAHFNPSVTNVCKVCGEEKETMDHFLFECPQAIMFWAQICVLFPSVRHRNRAQFLWFKCSYTAEKYIFAEEEKVIDTAIAEALFARWKERCRASIQAQYRYQQDKLWTTWAVALRLHQERVPKCLQPMPELPPSWEAVSQFLTALASNDD
jgi:hypothetical protein